MADLRFGKGEAELVALVDDRVNLVSTIPSAPGSRVDTVLASGASFRIKVHRSQKTGEVFAIEGRVIDLRREVRSELEAILAGRAPRA